MRIQREHSMRVTAPTVKKLLKNASAIAAVSIASIAPNAFASDIFKTVEVSVSFSKAELKANNGVSQVYQRLQAKALSACEADTDSLRYFGESIEACAADLVTQFVTTADIEALTAYHEARTTRV